MALEVRFVVDGVQQEDWTALAKVPGETDLQALSRKQASHQRNGWTVTRTGNTMSAVKEYPQNQAPHARRKERFFRVRN